MLTPDAVRMSQLGNRELRARPIAQEPTHDQGGSAITWGDVAWEFSLRDREHDHVGCHPHEPQATSSSRDDLILGWRSLS